ncbi:MAG TPA: hypothetical protein VF752_14970 [Thermoleophilaceae bacterium]
MKQRKNPLGRAAELAAGAAATVRGRRADRKPRAVIYDAAGHPRVVNADSPEGAALVETAEAMLEVRE